MVAILEVNQRHAVQGIASDEYPGYSASEEHQAAGWKEINPLEILE
jgi:hypothetical protein